MFSLEELISKYEKYTDDELFEIHANIGSYSDDAKKTFAIVLNGRGGLENLMNQQSEKRIISEEIQKIREEVRKLSDPYVDISFLKKLISSTILPQEKLDEIIETAHAELELEREDKKIKPRTILGSAIGGSIASVIGGILWGLQMIYSKKIFVILFIGLVLLCYGIIKLSTKQSKENKVVLIATVIAVIISVLIGQLLYEITGYQE